MILSDKQYNSIYSKVPRMCVDMVVRSDNGIVLVKRTSQPYKGKWHLPGGRVRFRENIKNALNRIAKSEIGCKVKIVRLLGYMEFLMEKQNEEKRHSISLVFEVTGKPTKGEVFHKVTNDVLSIHRKFIKENI